MKASTRIILLSLSLLVLSGSALRGQIRFNVHFDPQFAWLSSSDKDLINPDGSNFQMQAGIQMDYFFAENYAFILGFGINNVGGKLIYSDSVDYGTADDPVILTPDQRVKMKLQYLDIPLGLKLKTEELGYITGFLQVGFNPMFNINANITSDDAVFDEEDIQEEGVKVFNLGYHVGAGAEYRLGGNTALIGGIRWTSGLTNITQNDGANITMQAISIHLGLLF